MDDDRRMLVVDDGGVLSFNGCTAEERLAALDAPVEMAITSGDRRAEGIARAGWREGAWRYALRDEARFVVDFEDDRPIDPPAGWVDGEWPRPSIEAHRERREVLEIVLREYRRPEDIERIYRQLLPRTGNAIPIVLALRQALGLSLAEAKLALEAACERAKRRR